MLYQIRSLKNHNIIDGDYLFDANIWVDRISGGDLSTKGGYRNFYPIFFQNVFSTKNARIVLPTLLISEVVNAYLHGIGMSDYAKKSKLDHNTPKFYKEKYRKSDQFKKDLAYLLNEFKVYIDTGRVHIINDNSSVDLFDEVHSLLIKHNGDFNDLYYYKIARDNGFKIITDDIDFFLPDVEVFTLNRTLIDKAHTQLIGNINNQ